MTPREQRDRVTFRRRGRYSSGTSEKGQEGKAQEMVGILYQYYLEHFDLLPDYLKALRDRGERIESLVCDYVSSMTDRFAVARFEEIFVPKSWQVI